MTKQHHKTSPCVDVGRLRPEVLAFAHLMEAQLRANDHKPGWKGDHAGSLWDRLAEEASELHGAIAGWQHSKNWQDSTGGTINQEDGKRRHAEQIERVGREASDVANFAMMIADVCGALPEQAALLDSLEAVPAEGEVAALAERLKEPLAALEKIAAEVGEDCGAHVQEGGTLSAADMREMRLTSENAYAVKDAIALLERLSRPQPEPEGDAVERALRGFIADSQGLIDATRDVRAAFAEACRDEPQNLLAAIDDIWEKFVAEARKTPAMPQPLDREAVLKVLEPFGTMLKGNYSHQRDIMPIVAGSNEFDLRFKLTLGDLRRARELYDSLRTKGER